ncbi:HEAT repeat domain-containing protein [Myxococcota bacterium]|nr:HEAT repeat domain-containing protein [Myxococcota bacterium]
MSLFFRPPPRTEQGIVRDLSDPAPRVRAAAARELGRVEPDFPDLAKLLEKAMSDLDVSVRTFAVYSMLEQKLELPLLESIHSALEDSSSAVREAAVIGLVALPDPDAADRLRALVADPDAAVRYQAVLSAAEKGLDDLVPTFEAMLASDGDPRVRANLASALGELSPVPVETLRRAVAGDTDEEVRFEAAMALSRVAAEGASALLVPFLSRNDMFTDCLTQLCALSDASIRPQVESLYGRVFQSTVHRLQLGALLARLGDDRARGLLLSKTRSFSFETRIWAIHCLGLSGADWARETLTGIRDGKPDSQEAETARDALAFLDSTSPVAPTKPDPATGPVDPATFQEPTTR